MAKVISPNSLSIIIQKVEDRDNPGQFFYQADCRYQLGTTDDPALKSFRSKVLKLAGADLQNAQALYSSLESKIKQDEGIS